MALASSIGETQSHDAFLGVEQSLGGRRWVARAAPERLVQTLAQRFDLPDAVARALAGRGISADAAGAFLTPSLRAQMPDPSVLPDMDRATARLVRAIRGGESVAVFGDYDVDGATSAALLLRYLRALGIAARLYVPDRIAEGYGPNAPALEGLARAGVSLVVCVDCGTTAFAPLAAARAAGLDVLVLDHHTAEARLPETVGLVNPNRLDAPSGADDRHGLRHLAACGVTFLTLVALNRALRREGVFAGGAEEPDLLDLLDLVALGTVCDVVPLVGLNRALVAQGLKVIAGRRKAGLVALADRAGIKKRPEVYHLGFILGPRINAAGRIGQADLGARLLSTEDAAEAAAIAARLDDHNEDRKALEAAALAEAMAQVEALDDAGPVILASGEGWHPGVVGIVASRLKERYHRPACVVALDGDLGKASGRSVPGVDLGGAVAEARAAGLLLTGGGHPMAAGFSLTRDRLAELRAFLAEHIAAQVAARGDGTADGRLVPVMRLDGSLSVAGATPDLARAIARLGPFGPGNGEPRYVLSGARVVQWRIVGQNHISCTLTGPQGGRLRAIAFRAADTPLGEALCAAGGAPLHLAGLLRLDDWQGSETLDFHIEDAAPAWQG